MPSYEHEKVAGILRQMAEKLETDPQIQLLKENAEADEIILYANTPTTFIHAVGACEDDVTPPDYEDLLEWHSNPCTSRACYAYSSGSDKASVWLEDNKQQQPTRLLSSAQNIVFERDRQGIDDVGYYELLQEFSHAAALHWCADQRAYCRIDDNGDLEPVVSITTPDASQSVTLITCKREPLELFLASTDQALIRFYEITVVNRDRWPTAGQNGVRELVVVSQDLFYNREVVDPDGHIFIRGVQILRRKVPDQVLRG